MAIPDNKARITITIEKDLIEYLKERSAKTKRTPSNELSILLQTLKDNESKE